MDQAEKELGIALAILEDFETQTLPDALWIKERVDNGELLTETDIEFLRQVLESATNIKHLVDTQPRWQSLYANAIQLYEEITAKALANQQAIEAKKTA